MEGTHKGEWLGMKPTNKKLAFTGVDIDKVFAGKIVEHGGAVNTFETLFQEEPRTGSCYCKENDTKSISSLLRIFENYFKIHVDASFPAESMYLKRGYQIISYEKIETESEDFLCY